MSRSPKITMNDELNNDVMGDDVVAPMPEEEATEGEEVSPEAPAEETGEEAA